MTDQKDQKNTPSPITFRVSTEEKRKLEKAAAGLTISAYIRSCLFGENVTPRKTRGKHPVKDQEVLGKVLGQLGKSRLANNLNQLAKAVNMGTLPVSPDTEKEIREACAHVAAMRANLMKALGRLEEKGRSSSDGGSA